MGIEYIEQESVVPRHGVSFIVAGSVVGLGIMGTAVWMIKTVATSLVGA